MKFHETHFEEYINSNQKLNIHPKLDKIYNRFPKSIRDLKNIIFYLFTSEKILFFIIFLLLFKSKKNIF